MRHLKLVRNLLRWRRYTGELFGVGELTLRVVKECMRPVAEAGGGWEVGGGEVVEKVCFSVAIFGLDDILRTRYSRS